MKKSVVIPGVLLGGVFAWWGLSYSASNYQRDTTALVAFRNVTIASSDAPRLANFYQVVFQSEPVSSDWSVGASPKSGTALRTPGYGGAGPTLTFIASSGPATVTPSASDHGYAHLCFESEDVRGVIARLVAAGGTVSSVFEDNQKAPVLYAKDPDGNALEVHIPLPDPLTPRTVYRSVESLVRTLLKLSPPQEDHLRFLHANHNSSDWSKVADFYRSVFALRTVGARRDYEGKFIGELTGIQGAQVHGRHIQMPGYSAGGPTLEAFTYNQTPGRGPLSFSDAGVVAIGFDVQDLSNVLRQVVSAGGDVVGADSRGALVRDPFGNFIQLHKSEPQNTP